MSTKILYLGLDPKNFPRKKNLVHFPVIRIEKIQGPDLQKALTLWPEFTHVIFTSKNAVRLWWEERSFFDKIAIAIGEATAEELRICKVEPLVAPEALQEGVVALLEKLDLQKAFLFFPRSQCARSFLTDFLQKKRIRFFALDLYNTVLNCPKSILDLADFGEIVFTSPSTVHAFLQIYGAFPKNKKLTAIGPITQKALQEVY